MDFQARRRIRGSHRRGSALILAALVAALAMAIAAPAQATPNVAKAWGVNERGQLGNGETTGPEKCKFGPQEIACSGTPVSVSGLSGVKALAGGNAQSLALLEGATVMEWGNGSGVPAAVSGLAGVTAISAGTGNYNLALLSNGTVMAWGQNPSGQLGDGNLSSSAVPVHVCAVGAPSPCSEESQQLKGVIAVAAGQEHSLALLSNGTVVAWGLNNLGQLGDGTTTGQESCFFGPCDSIPVEVKGLSEEVTAIAVGDSHSLALLKNHTVVAWGGNKVGQLGDGSETSSDVPVKVTGLAGVVAISATGRVGNFEVGYSLALLSKGAVDAWGANDMGQLGVGESAGPEACGTTPCSKTPVAVCAGSSPGPCPTGPLLSGVSVIAAGGAHSLALLSNDTVKAWGENKEGQLGDGTVNGPEHCGPFSVACSTTPVEVTKAGDVKGIAAGGGHSLAVVVPPPSGPLPELGRCVEAKGLTGAYKNHFCVSPGAGHGRDNWLPGPGENKKFEGTGSATTLQTAKHKIICSTTIIDGEYLSAKTATATVILKGCINAATKATCQSNPANTGEIETTQPLEGELGFIKGGITPSVGLDLKKSSVAPNVASFSCGGPPQPEFLATVEGSVIAPLKPIDIMVQEFTLTYNVTTAGKQVPERFEGGVRDTLGISFAKGAEKPVEEEAGLKTTVTISNQEPLEIKAK